MLLQFGASIRKSEVDSRSLSSITSFGQPTCDSPTHAMSPLYYSFHLVCFDRAVGPGAFLEYNLVAAGQKMETAFSFPTDRIRWSSEFGRSSPFANTSAAVLRNYQAFSSYFFFFSFLVFFSNSIFSGFPGIGLAHASCLWFLILVLYLTLLQACFYSGSTVALELRADIQTAIDS
ncbi:hypothetical protein QBC37DRAFT_168897 [Rhypophila decipiens]|uniref:Uncharacterized protein n=1 Tax=Rhypophila decipiens TaxID=261697 RepID=A0AAN6YBU5_9PEZI|nr:hypothetical protein QBC37DRAFT_168897 [Rhypophila decipiens]